MLIWLFFKIKMCLDVYELRLQSNISDYFIIITNNCSTVIRLQYKIHIFLMESQKYKFQDKKGMVATATLCFLLTASIGVIL